MTYIVSTQHSLRNQTTDASKRCAKKEKLEITVEAGVGERTTATAQFG